MNAKRLLIIGAGFAGNLLLREIKGNPALNYQIIGFLDDHKKKGSKISGIPVLGDINSLEASVGSDSADEIVIAIPSLKKKRLEEIISLCKKTDAEVKILPATYDTAYSLKTGRPWIGGIRKIDLSDLLSREPISVDLADLEEAISGKNIFISGGGGSIGSELCKQLLEFSPKEMIIADNCEFNLYEVSRKLKEKNKDTIIRPIILDVKDLDSLEKIFSQNNIDMVFHAAAYKHVPLMESNILEAMKNNVFGTYNLASVAEKYKVQSFVLISTDKAVNPTSIMGVSKNISENVIKLFGENTKFVTVRFGNVLGSSGSLIPLLEEQIEGGGPLTITHPDMERYFMTIPEASQLIIHAGILGKDNEILILDMGESYKIKDIVHKLVRLKGLEPGKDIQIEYGGIRPGEKLYEELWTEKERLHKTKNERIFVSDSEGINKTKFIEQLEELKKIVLEDSKNEIKNKLLEMVPSYSPKFSPSSGGDEKRILITGDTGFVGSHVKSKLTELGYECYGFSKEDGDLSEKDLSEIFPKCGWVIHLASGLPQRGQKEFKKDVAIMDRVLDYCKKNDSKLIFSSSCAVYGDTGKEGGERKTVENLGAYARAKIECENLFRESGIGGFIFRIFNIYGPKQHESFFVPSLLNRFNSGELISLKKEVRRDFVHITDVVNTFVKAIECENCSKLEILDVGTGKSTLLEEILRILEEEGEMRAEANFESPQEGEILDSSADISKTKEILGWKPEISIREGIRQILALNKFK
jgi:FlaA1/EpsC-like NDP-sugar epimerase